MQIFQESWFLSHGTSALKLQSVQKPSVDSQHSALRQQHVKMSKQASVHIHIVLPEDSTGAIFYFPKLVNELPARSKPV